MNGLLGKKLGMTQMLDETRLTRSQSSKPGHAASSW